MTRILAFLGLILTVFLYGLVFDSIVASMATGQYCTLLEQTPCLIPQQVDRWFSIATLLLFLPVTCIAVINWFFNSQRRISTLFGWLIVAP